MDRKRSFRDEGRHGRAHIGKTLHLNVMAHRLGDVHECLPRAEDGAWRLNRALKSLLHALHVRQRAVRLRNRRDRDDDARKLREGSDVAGQIHVRNGRQCRERLGTLRHQLAQREDRVDFPSVDRTHQGVHREQLTARDALGAHARDELGNTDALRARPVQAALASAAAFAVGAVLPVAAALVAPVSAVSVAVAAVTLAALAVLGGVAGYVGGASVVRGAVRVTFWGALAMAITAGVGALFGTAV